MFGNGAAQPVAGDMRVNLRRRDIGMAQHALHAAQIGAMFDQMRSKSVPHDMWA